MSIEYIRSFVEVYRQGSISKAADALNLTQPAVSGHIANLETLTQRQLFVRHARGVRPTNIADELYVEVSSGLDIVEGALARSKARTTKLSGILHVCGPSDILSDLIVAQIKILTQNNLSIRLQHAILEQNYDRVLEGKSDFGVTVELREDERFGSALLGKEQIVLVAHSEMASSIKSADDLSIVLNQFPFLAYDRDRFLIRYWLSHNKVSIGNAEEIVTAADLRGLKNLILNNLGWSVLPKYHVQSQLDSGSIEVIDPPIGNPELQYHLIWLKSSMRNARLVRAKELMLDAIS